MTCSTDMTSLPLKPKQCCFLSNTLRRATIVSASGLIVALRRHCRHRVFRQRTQPCRRVLVPGEVQQQLHSITQQPSVRHISKGMNSGPSRSSTRMRASSVSRNSFLLAEMAVLQGSQEDSKSERALSLQAQPAHRRIGRTQLSPLGHSPKNFFFAAPTEQVRTSGASVGLGQILEIAKASDALELLVSAGQDIIAAFALPSSPAAAVTSRGATDGPATSALALAPPPLRFLDFFPIVQDDQKHFLLRMEAAAAAAGRSEQSACAERLFALPFAKRGAGIQ